MSKRGFYGILLTKIGDISLRGYMGTVLTIT